MRRIRWASILVAGSLIVRSVLLCPPSSFAGEDWKSEFEAVCGVTDGAMALKKEELGSLIVRCDKLKPLIDAEEETVRKVYLKRLKSCRDLYVYVLESRSRE